MTLTNQKRLRLLALQMYYFHNTNKIFEKCIDNFLSSGRFYSIISLRNKNIYNPVRNLPLT